MSRRRAGSKSKISGLVLKKKVRSFFHHNTVQSVFIGGDELLWLREA